MYDTGDRCRYLPSGSIEVIGRCDFMVKIRGYSVVIGAVEVSVVAVLIITIAISAIVQLVCFTENTASTWLKWSVLSHV